MKKAIFLDRDGTIIIDKVYLNDPDQIEYLPLVIEGLRSLRDQGYVFVVVTNQSGIARGIVQVDRLMETHRRIQAHFSQFGIDLSRYYWAPYSVESNHWMRKPNPGMLLTAAQDHGIDLTQSWMVGDRFSDIQAGQKAGTKTILLPGVETLSKQQKQTPDHLCSNLLECAQMISISKDTSHLNKTSAHSI